MPPNPFADAGLTADKALKMTMDDIIDKYRKNDGAKMALSYAKGLLTQLEIFETKDLVKEDKKWIPK